MKSGIWTAIALATASVGLVSCGEAPPPAETGPKAPDGVAVTDARVVLPAVKGNPGAVYFDVANTSQKNLMLRAVEIEGAGSAVFHQMGTWNLQPSMDQLEQIPLPPGGTVKFEPGAMHVMAMDIADTVTAGGTADVTLTFVGGDKLTFPAEVRAAGEDR